MFRNFAFAGAVALALTCAAERPAAAQNWYGGYYHTAWNQPVALVVPPNARRQHHYNWGVSNTRVTRIDARFGAGAVGYGGVQLQPTPLWPSSTDQFGVYPVRGPRYWGR